MIHSENNDASNIAQHQIAQFLHDEALTLEFITGGMEIEQGYLGGSLNHPINEGLQSVVPGDLRYIDSSDMLPVDPTLAAPPLSEFTKGNNVGTSEKTPVSNISPKLEEHDVAGMDFDIHLNPSHNCKNWYYSAQLRKVFIKLDKPFYIEVVYTAKTVIEQLYLRAMMVYVNNPFSPVQRCQNHLFTDQSPDEKIKHNVLRSENSDVTYTGTPGGKSVNDRLSIAIPLAFEKPNEDNQIKHSVALKFVCQNSCIGREPTAVIFTLENTRFEVLGKRILHVKVCSCPKRDKQNDENKFSNISTVKKRESEDMNYHPDKKPLKMMKIKEEPDSSSMASPLPAPSSPPKETAGVRITLDFPNISVARDVVKAAFNTVAGHMALNPRHSDKYSNCLKDLKKMLDEYNSNERV